MQHNEETNPTPDGTGAVNQKSWTRSEYQDKSEFTLLIYFRQGYTKGMKFHSQKQEMRRVGGFEIRDLRYAFNRLTYLVEDRFKGQYKTALLYHNPTGKVVMQWAYDHLKSKENYAWTYDTGGNVLFKMKEDHKVQDIQAVMKNIKHKY